MDGVGHHLELARLCAGLPTAFEGAEGLGSGPGYVLLSECCTTSVWLKLKYAIGTLKLRRVTRRAGRKYCD